MGDVQHLEYSQYMNMVRFERVTSWRWAFGGHSGICSTHDSSSARGTRLDVVLGAVAVVQRRGRDKDRKSVV